MFKSIETGETVSRHVALHEVFGSLAESWNMTQMAVRDCFMRDEFGDVANFIIFTLR